MELKCEMTVIIQIFYSSISDHHLQMSKSNHRIENNNLKNKFLSNNPEYSQNTLFRIN